MINLLLLLSKYKHFQIVLKFFLIHYFIIINSDYKEYNTDTTIKFVVTMSPEILQKAENDNIHRFFKLQSSLSLSSMVKC